MYSPPTHGHQSISIESRVTQTYYLLRIFFGLVEKRRLCVFLAESSRSLAAQYFTWCLSCSRRNGIVAHTAEKSILAKPDQTLIARGVNNQHSAPVRLVANCFSTIRQSAAVANSRFLGTAIIPLPELSAFFEVTERPPPTRGNRETTKSPAIISVQLLRGGLSNSTTLRSTTRLTTDWQHAPQLC
jgi:hypothetical protein